MTRSAKRSCLGRVGIGLGMLAALTSGSARAGGPLLVVVEAPPALDADAAEIRRAIGAELRSRTVAPMKTPAETSDRALIVALDRDRIAMSLRTSDAAPVARSIPSPPERAARLRAIAWLAGNLARDQVGPIVAEAPIEMPSLATLPSAAVAPSATEPPPPTPAAPVAPTPAPPASSGTNTTTPPPPAAAESIEPPAFEPPAATVATRLDRAPARQSPWTVAAAAGPAISIYETAHALRQSIFGSWNAGSAYGDVSNSSQTVWRVELLHRADSSRSFTGLALEGSRGDFESEVFGAMAFVGSSLQLGRWSLEASIGAGIDAVERPQAPLLYPTTSNGVTFPNDSLDPGLYAAGSVAVSHPIVESIAAVLSLNAHVSVIDEHDGYLASMLGLRYRLQ